MSKINILDCTLRDGGYINNWIFGNKNINLIIKNLIKSKIDLIEIGYLKENLLCDLNSSIYSNFKQASSYLKNKKELFICMINYGEYGIEDIPDQSKTLIYGIRIAFHKKDMKKALEYSKKIKDKGYKVFIQPMVTKKYSHKEFMNLISIVNTINPYAFYFVDSFGEIYPNELLKNLNIMDKYLNKEIALGFHSHNNLQLSFSNAQLLINQNYYREIIIDSSCMGIGRGAGNLNTELITEYLNSISQSNYNIEPILEILDNVLVKIYKEKYWGYSLQYYISAKIGCHPNYSTYLYNKQTLTLKSIYKILKSISSNKIIEYDEKHIEKLYLNHMKNCKKLKISIRNLKESFENKNILILSPGKTLINYENDLKQYIKKQKPIIISCNFEPKNINYDYIFVSNEKRLEKLNKNVNKNKLIITSNLYALSPENFMVLDYNPLINENGDVFDSATLLLLTFLVDKLNIKKISLAGFDGFSYNNKNNYYNDDMNIIYDSETIDQKNKDIKYFLEKITQKIDINFITPSQFDNFF